MSKMRVLAILAPLAIATGVALAATIASPSNISKQAGYNAEGTIAVNPTDPNKVFAGFNNDSTFSQWRRSTDGGTNWGTAGTGLGLSCCDNVAEWDSHGNLYLTNLNDTVDEIPLYVSTDDGASFDVLQMIDNTGNALDQPSVKAGPSSVWVTWNQNGKILARGASVTGLGDLNIGSFPAAQEAPGSLALGGQFGDIAVGPSGQVVVAWQTSAPDPTECPCAIYVNTDANGVTAGGFATQVKVADINVPKWDSISPQQTRTIDSEANLAYDLSSGPNAGRLYLVYTDAPSDTSSNTDIYLRHSDDNGATWSSAVKVNNDATTRSQFFPVVTVDSTTGNVFVSFLDCRADSGNTKTEYWGAVSTNGGATFGPNVKLSQGQSSSATQSDPYNEYGDYSGNDYYGSVAYAIWPDNSNSTGDNTDGQSDFDMYAGKLTGVPSGPPPVIKSFGPSKGPNGTVVKLKGTGFTGTNDVEFNGMDAYSFSATSDTQLTAVVPVGATSGLISVTNADGAVQTAKPFTVTPPKTPSVGKFKPGSAPVTSTVMLSGSGFFGATDVKFNGTDAQSFTVDSDKQITAVIAAGSTSGPVSVTAPGGTGTSKKPFNVTP